jgi:hypothetical protein
MLKNGIDFIDDNSYDRITMIQTIIDANGFDFDMKDISKLRTEFQSLIEKLSLVYASWWKRGRPDSETKSAKLSNDDPKYGILRSTSTPSESKMHDRDTESHGGDCRRGIDFGTLASPLSYHTTNRSKSHVEDVQECEGNNFPSLGQRDTMNGAPINLEINRYVRSTSSCLKDESDFVVETSQMTMEQSIVPMATLRWTQDLHNLVIPGEAHSRTDTSMINHALNVIDTDSI